MAAAEVEASTQPVREKLKKASLDTEATNDKSSDTENMIESTTKPLNKKRSHEDIADVDDDDEDTRAQAPAHTRKRSRDSTAELDEHEVKKRASGETAREKPDRPATPEADDTPAAEDVASPKTKRSRLQEQDSTTASKSNVSSGFSNTSVTSPFGAVASPKSSEPDQTSTSAFAASGFSALSKSTTSGFGAIAKSSGGFGSSSSFASKTAETTEPTEKKDSESKSVFGGSLGAQSAFSAPSNGTSSFGGSAFSKTGGLGSAFASKGGFGALGGGGLSSFASGKGSSSFGSKPAKAFGASAEEGEDDGEEDGEDAPDDSGIKSPLSVGTDEEKKDERFYEQEVETGEEEEEIIFSARAKLYTYGAAEDGAKQWKERGIGVIKLNKKRASVDDEESQTSSKTPEGSLARLLMRADGSHRVVLNSLITKDIKVAQPGGGSPTRGFLMFMGTTSASSTLELLQLKLKQQLAVELYDKVQELQNTAVP